jgi:hypothetical protein
MDWKVTDQYSDKSTGLIHAYTLQSHHGISVYNAISIFVFKNNKAVYFKSGFIEGLKAKVNTERPSISARTGIDFALKHLELAVDPSIREKESKPESNVYTFEGGIYSAQPIKVELVYVPVDDKVVLAWNVSIEMKKQSHWWNVRVDAMTGAFISKNDYVVHCSFDPMPTDNDGGVVTSQSNNTSSLPPPGDGYHVFPLPLEAATFGSRSLLNNPADPASSPYGWLDVDGIAGADYTITRGNNVYAYEDQNNDDAPGYSPDGGPTHLFDFPYNPAVQPINNMDASLTNLFYVNNAIHDWLNHLGFSAPEGNFQQNNYGAGGLGGDYVIAEGFDGSGTDNANFATPPDGSNPRMQMYLWAGAPCGSLTINSPATIAGAMTFGGAGFNPFPSNATGALVLVNDGSAQFTEGCNPIINNISGKIALIDRGTCAFLQKVFNAQTAGAIGVIVVNNIPGGGVFNMPGSDPSITIPSVLVSYEDGLILKNEMLVNTVNVSIVICESIHADSDFDNGIIVHEYGHGVSTRLTGGPSNVGCLFNGEEGGEGWSDWLALMLTIEPGDHGTDPRGIGSYAEGQPTTGSGIRTYPYSTDMNIDPHTYGDLALNTEVHYIGEIWCSAVWDLSWALIDQYGYDANPNNSAAGNNVAIKLILEGMKLQPCGPGFLDARDAILFADHLLYNDAHRCKIWDVFARRGMGWNADQGSSNFAGDETEDFSLPPGVQAFVTGGGNFCRPQDALLDAGTGWLSYDWGNGIHTQTYVPTTFGPHTVTVSGIGCSGQIETGTGTATVNQAFNPSVSASPAQICPTGSSQLLASFAESIGQSNLESSQFSAPAPYGSWFTAEHNQYLIHASELTSLGFAAGNLTSLAFDVVTHNTGPGSRNLTISLAHTSVTDLGTTFISSGFTQVYFSPNFVSVPGWNTHTFSTPFNWDGTSNIVVDISMLNCNTCPGSPCIDYYTNDIVHMSATPFVSTTINENDNDCTVPTFTPVLPNNTLNFRPNMLFTGNQTGGTITYTYAWTPSTFLNNTTIANPLASNVTTATEYTVTVTKSNGCYATASQRIDLIENSFVPTVSATPPSICPGSSSQLSAQADIQLGTDILTNSFDGLPATYGSYYTSHHEQYLIRAIELSNAGLQAGNITSLAFDVVQHNAGLGSRNFAISLAQTPVNELSTSFINSGFSLVYFSPSYLTTEGWNVHNFSSPFFWDGVSNIVVNVSMLNCSSCPTVACTDFAGNDILHYSFTPFVATLTTAADADCSVPTFTPSSQIFGGAFRPNLKLTGASLPASFSWSPGTYLNNSSIYNPLASNVTNTTTYTVTVTKANGCSASATQAVNVIAVPAMPAAISGKSGVCKGQAGVVYCTEEVPGATSYIWTLPTGATGVSTTSCITVNFSTKFNGGNICVKAVNSCFTGPAKCKTITVISVKPAKPNPITGTSSVCLPATNTYCITAVPTADSYAWSVNGNGGANPMTIISGNGSTCVIVDIPVGYNGAQWLTVKAINCKGTSDERKQNIYVISVPSQPASISGPSPVCKTKTKSYSCSIVSGAASYNWSVTGGAAIISGQGTSAVNVKFTTATSTTAVLSVVVTNACGSSAPKTKTIAVTLTCKESEEDDITANLQGLSAFNVYPNPTNGKITLSFNSDRKTKLALNVVDLLGKTLISDEIETVEGLNTKNLDLSRFAEGMYFIFIVNEGREVQALRIAVE